MLVATQVRHRHRRSSPEVLRGVDLVVRTGESVAITGPSGSGKTTLLAVLGGLLDPTSGSVTVVQPDGVPGDLTPSDVVSWVLQTTNVLTDRSVLDNVVVGALGDGVDRATATSRAGEALIAVGLAALADRPVRTLSGGETQRVAIARALASRRGFVLADEPTGQLDQTTTSSVLDVLLGGGYDQAIVVVTHDPAVAARCDRTLGLRDGELLVQA
jgi:putative ABC transport system ATP-binding protein/lipoprotein-releasing system ATP-binding protein